MSKLNELRVLQQRLENLTKERDELEAKVKPTMDLANVVREMAVEQGVDIKDLVAELAPNLVKASVSTGTGKTRKPRSLKIYTNPHTGETVETKGGNHKTLKAWKDEHGAGEVESWAVIQ